MVSIDRDGAWVSFGYKYEGLITSDELRSSDGPLKVGDEVLVYVMSLGKREGGLLLSYDRARRYLGWQDLEKKRLAGETVCAQVVTSNRGGLIVKCQEIEGFIPISETVGGHLQDKMGKQLEVKVLEATPRTNRLVLSERLAWLEAREKAREKALLELREGEGRRGKVTGIQDFGVFVDVGGVEGLCPLSELCWERGKTPKEVVRRGQEVEVVVLRVDPEAKRVLLSLKRAQPHPWETVPQRYKVGQMVFGTVTHLFPFGALAQLDGAIEGLVHISELSSRRIGHPKEVVKEGQVLALKVISIDPLKRHLRLSLRQAQEEEEYRTLGKSSDV